MPCPADHIPRNPHHLVHVCHILAQCPWSPQTRYTMFMRYAPHNPTHMQYICIVNNFCSLSSPLRGTLFTIKESSATTSSHKLVRKGLHSSLKQLYQHSMLAISMDKQLLLLFCLAAFISVLTGNYNYNITKFGLPDTWYVQVESIVSK